MIEEQYSIQAETLMKTAVEDYQEIIEDIQAANANMNVLKGIRVTVNGKPRRLVDIGDLKSGDTEKQLKVLVFNTDHIPLLVEEINNIDFDSSVDGQFITIDVPDPSYKQLMEVVEDLNRKKNSAVGRLTKAKSEATTRARTAVENEFIEQNVASKASKACDLHYDTYSAQINDFTTSKIKDILGEEFYKKYLEEEEFLSS